MSLPQTTRKLDRRPQSRSSRSIVPGWTSAARRSDVQKTRRACQQFCCLLTLQDKVATTQRILPRQGRTTRGRLTGLIFTLFGGCFEFGSRKVVEEFVRNRFSHNRVTVFVGMIVKAMDGQLFLMVW